jgi:prepilin-type N-terminal cleavage/methylation domain-containing protein
MRRPPNHPRSIGFTLLEMILVMCIIAILAGVLVPSLSGFAAGRRTSNAATLVLSLANYARTQAVAEGTVYRLNFDDTARTVWLTKQTEGAFQPAPGDWGERQVLPDGVRMVADVTPGAVIVPVQSPDVQTTNVTPAPPFGPTLGTANTLVQVPHADGGSYAEIQPSGRTDPCHVRLSDETGHAVDLGAATATDVIHVLKPGEM